MKKYFKYALFSILGFAIISYAELPDPPKGIHIKYATTEDLSRTLMDKGEILVNEDDVSDVRIGDGVTYGGKQIASSVLANYFPLTGGVLNGYLIDIVPTNVVENPTIVLRRNGGTTWKIVNDGQLKFIRYVNDTEYDPTLQVHNNGVVINSNLTVGSYIKVDASPVIPANKSIAVGSYAYTKGVSSISVGNNTHAYANSAVFGENNYAFGLDSMANGSRVYAIGNSSHAEGAGTMTTDTTLLFTSAGSSVLGKKTLYSNKSHGLQVHDVLKYGNLDKYVYVASIPNSTTIVLNTTFSSELLSNAVLTKLSNVAYGDKSHTEGNDVTAIGSNSHAEGNNAKAIGSNSHAEGNNAKAIGSNSHVEGSYTQATGNNSHAEGNNAKAIGSNSHVEGYYAQANGGNSHAEGVETQANGYASHAEGSNTQANGDHSHSEGVDTQANGYASNTSGKYAITTNDYAWVWSAHLINQLKEFELTNYNDSEFNLPGIPKNKTFESIFGIDQNTWENLDHIYVYYEDDDHYIDNEVFLTEDGWFTRNEDDELVSINSYIENIPYDKFLNIAFTFTTIDSVDEITWTTELYDARYYSHGDKTFNVNPENGLDGFYIGEKPLSSLKWGNQEVYIGISDDDNYETDYNDGDEIQLQNKNGSIQYFGTGNGGPASITLILPEITLQQQYEYSSLTLFIYESDDGFIRYNISSDNCYAPWFPVSQPWDNFDECAVWKIKFESPPGTLKWYFLGAENYPY